MKKNLLLIICILGMFFQCIDMFAQGTQESMISVPTALRTNRDVTVSVYPQPTSGPVMFEFSDSQSHNPKIQLFDLLGNLVGSYEAEKTSGNTFTINLADKKPGYYFVKIQADSGNISRRITIKP
ncbi:hypothetical protein BH11BAC2_BH11BAC2_09930 [soil metagenome]